MLQKKKLMIGALKKKLGVITHASRELGISRQTHYDWLRSDEIYKQEVESASEEIIDLAESALFKQIMEGNTTAIIFFLKTRGKKRGYNKKQEI